MQIVDVVQTDQLANDIRIYDDSIDAQGCNILGVPVVGTLERIDLDISDGLIDAAIIAVGSIAPREQLFKRFLNKSIDLPNIVSSKAIVSSSAVLGVGNIILPQVYIGPKVLISDNNYFTTLTAINHDTSIGSHCYFSTSVAVAGRVTIRDRIRFDTGCSITADAFVEADSLIGPGEVYGPVRGR